MGSRLGADSDCDPSFNLLAMGAALLMSVAKFEILLVLILFTLFLIPLTMIKVDWAVGFIVVLMNPMTLLFFKLVYERWKGDHDE